MVVVQISGFSQLFNSMYTDRLKIHRFVEVENEDGTQDVELSKSPVYDNVPCRISFANSDNPDSAQEERNPERLQLKLFCAADVDIRKGDKLTALRMAEDGTTILQKYTGTANLPAQYVTHKEVLITEVGEA